MVFSFNMNKGLIRFKESSRLALDLMKEEKK